jgi:ligand-binding SRPBCC domain-containing protein
MTSTRTIRRSTVLDAPADLVWAAVRTPQAFRYVTRGIVDWRPARRRTEPWQQGDEATGWLLLGGVLPFSMHRIRVACIDDHERVLRSDESGGVIRSWRHDIHVEPLDGGRSRYTDVVHIDAGPLTPVVAAFAWFLYRERQRRWRVLAPILGGTDQSRHSVARSMSGSSDGERRAAAASCGQHTQL